MIVGFVRAGYSHKVVESTDKATLQGFVVENTTPDAIVYSDEAAACSGLPREHETVKHSVSEYVRGMAHTNGIESFWAMMARAHTGTFHKMSPRHLDRYVQEFSGKHNFRDSGTLDQMRATAVELIGHSLPYRRLVAPNSRDSGARA